MPPPLKYTAVSKPLSIGLTEKLGIEKGYDRIIDEWGMGTIYF